MTCICNEVWHDICLWNAGAVFGIGRAPHPSWGRSLPRASTQEYHQTKGTTIHITSHMSCSNARIVDAWLTNMSTAAHSIILTPISSHKFQFQVKKQYLHLSKSVHPDKTDRNKQGAYTRRFQLLSRAKGVFIHRWMRETICYLFTCIYSVSCLTVGRQNNAETYVTIFVWIATTRSRKTRWYV